MAWPHCERLDDMTSQISCEHFNVIASQIYFFLSPQSIVPSTPNYIVLDTSDGRPAFSACIGGGVGVVTITPSRTSASAVIYISPTRVTNSSATQSRAVTVFLYLRVSGTISPAPFLFSPVVFMICATIDLRHH